MLLTFSQFLLKSQSNSLIGVMPGGGPRGCGVIYQTDSVARFKKILHAFEKIEGRRPVGELALSADGSFYGVTQSGGKFGKGTLFQYFPATAVCKTVYHFGENSQAAAFPMAGVLIASNGRLYGSTQLGGINGKGTLYCYNPIQDSFAILHSFVNINESGHTPQAVPVETKSGRLLLVTFSGGKYGNGAIYQMDTTTLIISKAADFNNSLNGRNPLGYLVETDSNVFFGLTQSGGSTDEGVLFRFDLNNLTLSNLKDFTNFASGEYPSGGLMLASNGKLYGTTSGFPSSNDVLFEFNPADSQFKKLVSFSSAKGEYPNSVLVEGNGGVLYGTTSYGANSNNEGSLYAYTIGSDSITKLWTFNGSKYGYRPRSGVRFGKDGKLYGLVNEGSGAAYDGTLYVYDTGNSEFERPVFFNSSMKGKQPVGQFAQAANGMLYGTTQAGGANNLGVIYSVHPQTFEVNVEADFNDSSGHQMEQGFIEASNGKLYGVCSNSSNLRGSIVEFDPQTKILRKMADFDEVLTGDGQSAGLSHGGNSLLYGVRSSGGLYGHGTLFSYQPGSNQIVKLHDFNQNSSGRTPQGRPVQVNGKLYGLTHTGGANDEGVLYEYQISGGQFNVKLSFSRNISGKRPVGSLLLAHNGRLYGSTTEGGDRAVGSLFEYQISNNTLVVKASYYRGLTEERASGEMLQSSNGYLYGLTYLGGDNDAGVMLEYRIGTNVFTRTYHLIDEVHGNYGESAPFELNICRFTKTDLVNGEISARAIQVNYQWLNCDKNFEIIPGAIAQTFKPQTDGRYAVEISSRFCKDTSVCTEVLPSDINSISDANISIYPNPAQKQVWVRIAEPGMPAEVQVYNSLGMLVHNETLTGSDNLLSKQFDAGLYKVVIRHANSTLVYVLAVLE